MGGRILRWNWYVSEVPEHCHSRTSDARAPRAAAEPPVTSSDAAGLEADGQKMLLGQHVNSCQRRAAALAPALLIAGFPKIDVFFHIFADPVPPCPSLLWIVAGMGGSCCGGGQAWVCPRCSCLGAWKGRIPGRVRENGATALVPSRDVCWGAREVGLITKWALLVVEGGVDAMTEFTAPCRASGDAGAGVGRSPGDARRPWSLNCAEPKGMSWGMDAGAGGVLEPGCPGAACSPRSAPLGFAARTASSSSSLSSQHPSVLAARRAKTPLSVSSCDSADGGCLLLFRRWWCSSPMTSCPRR